MRTLSFLLCFILFSCKNHYNDTLHWIDNIQPGTDISKVKASQPPYVTTNWNNARMYNDSTYGYKIEKIRGNNDILNMPHYLIFRNDKFLMRQSRK